MLNLDCSDEWRRGYLRCQALGKLLRTWTLWRARHGFDPRTHDTDFHNTFAGLGYTLVANADAQFGIEVKGMPLLCKPALDRAA